MANATQQFRLLAGTLVHPKAVAFYISLIQQLIADVLRADWKLMLCDLVESVWITVSYMWTIYSLVFGGLEYESISSAVFDTWSRVHVYHLAITFKLWRLPHYRAASYQKDLMANLKNVAIPGTGIPLSVVCCHFWVGFAFVLVGIPLLCVVGAVHHTLFVCSDWPDGSGNSIQDVVMRMGRKYRQLLLRPTDWYSLWRLNCSVTALHAHVTGCAQYTLENKWEFLCAGDAHGDVPVSPFLKADVVDDLVCKHKNIEGGMGINFFRNASAGGDWILQKRMHNAPWLQELLPENAPLSTMRVITSRSAVDCCGDAKAVGTPAAPSSTKAETCVLRLGKKGALTDHSAVLFDVDSSTGVIGHGATNSHWYQLGLLKNNLLVNLLTRRFASTLAEWVWHWLVLRIVPVVLEKRDLNKSDLAPRGQGALAAMHRNAETYMLQLKHAGISEHPDLPPSVDAQITGKIIPGMAEALSMVTRAHESLLGEVPLVGWDVAFTRDEGVCLLEVNLSCNFFMGTVDMQAFVDLVDGYWRRLDPQLAESASREEKKNA